MKEIEKTKMLKEYERRWFWHSCGLGIYILCEPFMFGASVFTLYFTVSEFCSLLIFPYMILWILQGIYMPSLPGNGTYREFEEMYSKMEYQKREKKNWKWIG